MRLRLAVLALGLISLAAPAFTAPAHYIVFSADAATGAIRPLFYRRVELAEPPASRSAEELRRAAAALSREEAIRPFALVDARGETLFRQAAVFPTVVRGEFHAEPQGGSRWSIDGHRFPEVAPAFAVRLPIVAGARLVFDAPGAPSFDLDALAAGADRLPLAAYARLPARVTARVQTGSPANRVDVVILGDGYTAAQSAKFNTDASGLEAQFFSLTPYKEYKNFVNISYLFTASAQSGADHPPDLATCSSGDVSCCADSTMLSDPLRGTFVNTAFNGRFCSNNLHRLAVVDSAPVLAAAAAVPDWDRLFVLLNDATYGGSGGSISVSSTNAQATDIARHEFGHSFTGLADEYDSAFPGYPACSDVSGGAHCEANVTDQTNRALIKWAPWIAASTPVPTPEGNASFTHLPGLFEGARYKTTGMYRHRDNDCLMKVLGVAFGEVCAQEYVLRLYRGGWGIPAAGIDPIEPGSEMPATGSTIPATTGVPVSFSADLLAPVGGPAPSVGWWVNGTLVPLATASSFAFTPPAAGNYLVELRVRDTTALVHPSLAGTDLQTSRQWAVVATGAGAPANRFYSLPPCRALDTRNAAGPYGGPALTGGIARSFALAGRCGLPASARAVSANLAVVGPSADGNLRAYPGGVAEPATSAMNFRTGQIRANNIVLPVAADGNATVILRPDMGGGTVHLLLDVNGYFAPPGP